MNDYAEKKRKNESLSVWKTLRLTFSLRNTYRVNSILHALRQTPLLSQILPPTLYQERGLKIFADVLSVFWELVMIFLWKGIYFLVLVLSVSWTGGKDGGAVFLHVFVICTVLGAFVNTYMFHPSRDKYYALILLRMDARIYTLVNYGYAMGKLALSYLIFGLLAGRAQGLEIWQCLLLPVSACGAKLSEAAFALWRYEKTGTAFNEDKAGKGYWAAVVLFLAAAFLPPFAGMVLPKELSLALMAAGGAAGGFSLLRILRFSRYRQMYQELLTASMDQMDRNVSAGAKAIKLQSEKALSLDTDITSSRKGFEYLNELFIRRHQRILWRASEKVAVVSFLAVIAILAVVGIRPDAAEAVNLIILQNLPLCAFLMYAINRGTGFTQVLFVNCDCSLLTYSFYKKPAQILTLFRIRLREIIRVNLLPAVVIGGGLALILLASGGTDNPLNYLVVFASIVSMSIFFSVHYLTLYYLLQPYTAGAELKSGTYRLVLTVTYMVCYLLIRVKIPTLLFGVLCIVFCMGYSAAACLLVYRMAPGTFRLKG